MHDMLTLVIKSILYFQDKGGITKEIRREIVDEIFGEYGIAKADNTILFEQRLADSIYLFNTRSQDFSSYFESRIKPILRSNLTTSQKSGRCVPLSWTNNNCESVNHQLKQVMNWKSQQLLDLVDKLYDTV